MHAIAHPEYCTIFGGDGGKYRGPDQDWFPTLWQQKAGCGPTTAALIFAYLAATRAELRPLHGDGAMEQAAFTTHMCAVWEYVKPACHGLNKPQMMQAGMVEYGAARGVTLSPTLLETPSAVTRRPPFEEVASFVARSLDGDCPVAFLNLCNGKTRELDRWHWVTIIGLEGGSATILDNGNEFVLDLPLWYATTKKRGGFVSALGGAG